MFTSVSAPREETKPHIALAVAAARVSTILFRLTTLPQNRKAPSSNVVPMPVASHHSCLRLSTRRRRRPFDAAVSRSLPPLLFPTWPRPMGEQWEGANLA